jgi:hypothetical protein
MQSAVGKIWRLTGGAETFSATAQPLDGAERDAACAKQAAADCANLF